MSKKEDIVTALIFPQGVWHLFSEWKLAAFSEIIRPDGHEIYRSYHPGNGVTFTVHVNQGKESGFVQLTGLQPLAVMNKNLGCKELVL